MASAEESDSGSQDTQDSSQSDHILFEIVPASRSGGNLLYTLNDKQLFRKNTKSRKGYYYVCRIDDCSARVFFDFATQNCTRSKKHAVHSHSNNQKSAYEDLKVQHKIKRECEGLAAMNTTQLSAIFNRNVQE